MKEVKKLTPKMMQGIEYMVSNPNYTRKSIAEALGKSESAVYWWLKSPIYMEAYEKELRNNWKSYIGLAQEKIIDLIENGKDEAALSASKFVLESNGYKAVDKVDINTDTGLEININYGSNQ